MWAIPQLGGPPAISIGTMLKQTSVINATLVVAARPFRGRLATFVFPPKDDRGHKDLAFPHKSREQAASKRQFWGLKSRGSVPARIAGTH